MFFKFSILQFLVSETRDNKLLHVDTMKAIHAQSSVCIEPCLTVVLLAFVSLHYRWPAVWWSRL